MKNVRPVFEAYEGNKEDLPPGYQHIKFHMIFDIKLDNNFRRKARLGRRRTHDNSILLNHIIVGSVNRLSQDNFDYFSIERA